MRLLGDLAANPRRRLCLVLVAALGLMFVGLVAARPMRAARSTLAMPRSLEFAGSAETESFGGGMPMFDGGSVSAASAPMAPASSMQRSEMRQKMAKSATTTSSSFAADAFTLSEADREEATAVPGGSMIVRTASLALEVADVAAAVDGLAKRATADGGFSQSSNVYQDQSRSSPAYGSLPEADLGEAERAKLAAERARPSRAYLTLRVPTGKLDSFLGFCRSLGTRVLRETIAGEDVSAEYVDVKTRELVQRKALEQLSAVMARAEQVQDVLDVQREMARVTEGLERSRAQRKSLESRASLATVNVELSLPPPIPNWTRPLADGWTPMNALRSAVADLIAFIQGSVDLLIYSLVFLAPVAVFTVALFVVFRLCGGPSVRDVGAFVFGSSLNNAGATASRDE